ncbi:hypothetical protein SASPL_134363 [Salvia splendens]|uniref:Terpene synthase metal-binding domain-containing protein n=1 Tax=Salvia splendens TaxID=180675 RepID=A0A8X8ZJZ6_SALSN|nr:hypothetical protein SASPL_134363 [Salvia splendens]
MVKSMLTCMSTWAISPWGDLCSTYAKEAEWYHTGYKPTMEEYINVAWVSISAHTILTHVFYLLSNPIEKEAAESVRNHNDTIRYSSMVLRLANDLGTSPYEMERGGAPKAVECYMNETGASREEAREHVMCIIRDIWTKTNEERFKESAFSDDFIRQAQYMYQHGDGHGISNPEMEERILAMEIMGMCQLLPRLVVFDLDYTLWPFYCECRSKRDMPRLYPHAKGILYALKDKGVKIAIASRSPTPDIANTFLDKLGIKSMLVAQVTVKTNCVDGAFLFISIALCLHFMVKVKVKEIFSSWTHKTDHFQRINRRTNIPYAEMLFFDDEDRNIDAVSNMGVTSILVGNGVNLGALRQGLSKYSQNQSPSGRSKRGSQNLSKKSSTSETEEQ